MYSKFISNIFNSAFNPGSSQLTANKNEIGSADASLIVDRDKRAGILTRFLVTQAGGYDPKYYTKTEAKKAAALAPAKFASVSLATFSFMKAIEPAFNNDFIQTLPTMGNIDAKHILMGSAAAGTYAVISKLDTMVLHAMRSDKASRAAKEINLDNSSQNSFLGKTVGLSLRYGISAGSLGISLLGLTIAITGPSLDQILQNRNALDNKDIIEMHQAKLTQAETELKNLETKRLEVLAAFQKIQSAVSAGTPNENKRLEELSSLITKLQTANAEQEAKKIEEEAKRDEAQSRIKQETKGTRGSIAGCDSPQKAPKCFAAIEDRTDSERRIETINGIVSRNNAEIAKITGQINVINTAIADAATQRDERAKEDRESLKMQLTTINNNIAIQIQIRNGLKDVYGFAANDPNYKKFNPSATEKANAFSEYWIEKATVFNKSLIAGMALIVICAELGVFALASTRRLNNGELRGHLAEILNSKEAVETFKRALELQKLKEEVGTDDGIASLKKKRRIMEIDEQNFEAVLEKLRNDPDLRNQMFEEVLKAYKEFGMNSEHAEATDVRGSGSTVSADKQEDAAAGSNIDKKKPSNPEPS